MPSLFANLARRFFGTIAEKASSAWITSTVSLGDENRGRYSNPPGRAFVARATQYVLICAMNKAGLCASQRLRLYAPARNGSSGKRIKDRKRIGYLKSRVNGPGLKAAEWAEYAEDVQEITDHPALDLIRKPNPWQSGYEFDELAYAYKFLSGNAYLYIYTDEATPEMYHLFPQDVTINANKEDFIQGYSYGRDRAAVRFFGADDVLHLKNKANPVSPYYGLGDLQAVMLEADLSAAATQAEYHRWLQGGRPDFVVEVDPATASNATARDQIKAEIKRETQGVRKTGRFLVMGNAKINPLGFRPKDMEYIAGLERCDELIWNAFGVPQSELKMNDANYASASTGNVQYLARTIAPACCRHAADLTQGILYDRLGYEPGTIWFAYDPIVPENEQAEAEMDRQDAAGGILTWNEVRSNRGLEPYAPEIGDVPRVNGKSVTALDAPPPVPQFGPPQQNDGAALAVEKAIAGLLPAILSAKAESVRLPGESVSACVSRKIPIIQNDHPDWSNDQCVAVAESMCREGKDHGADIRGRVDDVGDRAERQARNNGHGSCEGDLHNRDSEGGGSNSQAPAKHRITEATDSLSSKESGLKFYGPHFCSKEFPIADAPRGTGANLDTFTARLDAWYREAIRSALPANQPAGGHISVPRGDLDAILKEELTSLFNFAAVAGAREVGQSLDVAPSSALEFLSTYHVRLAQSISDDLSDSLTSAIRQGIEAGDSYAQISARVGEAAPDMAGWRAERVARTETSNALTQGRIFAWDDLGVAQKKWILSGNPCPMCEGIALSYQGPIPMTQPFYKVGEVVIGTDGNAYPVEWRDIQGNPAHPGCACGIMPVME